MISVISDTTAESLKNLCEVKPSSTAMHRYVSEEISLSLVNFFSARMRLAKNKDFTYFSIRRPKSYET